MPLCLIPQNPIKKHVMKAALKSGVEKGTLIQIKNSYKLSPEAKKPLKKAVPKKKAAPKKAAPKKKATPKEKTAPKKKSVREKKMTPKEKSAPKKKTTTKVKISSLMWVEKISSYVHVEVDVCSFHHLS